MEQAYCEAIRFAIELEQKSADFYGRAAEKTSNSFAKKALEFLAADEMTHIKKIEDFNAALINNQDFDFEAECKNDLPERLEKFLGQLVKKESEHISKSVTDIDVYNTAMEREKEGYAAYTGAYQNESEDPRVKEFFKFLAGQETIHYNMLASSKKYLEDPSAYFEEYGGWIFG